MLYLYACWIISALYYLLTDERKKLDSVHLVCLIILSPLIIPLSIAIVIMWVLFSLVLYLLYSPRYK